MTDPELTRLLTDLAERVGRLERAQATPVSAPAVNPPLVEQLVQRLTGHDDGGGSSSTLLYAGIGGWGGRTLAWQMERTWEDVRAGPPEPSAALFAALGNPTRVRITAELLAGPRTTAELSQCLDQPSSGQLFHHLKDLLAANVIHQPVRGTYAVREQHVIALLTLLSAAMDLRPSLPWEDQ